MKDALIDIVILIQLHCITSLIELDYHKIQPLDLFSSSMKVVNWCLVVSVAYAMAGPEQSCDWCDNADTTESETTNKLMRSSSHNEDTIWFAETDMQDLTKC